MNNNDLELIVNYIVDKGEGVIKKYLEEPVGNIDYLAIFCKDDEEKKQLLDLMNSLGEVIQDTPTGPNFKLKTPIETKSGKVGLIKIRNTDSAKIHRGAPDFKVDDYEAFKNKYLGREHFNLIERQDFEMIEIWDPEADVLVYFPNIPLTNQLGI